MTRFTPRSFRALYALITTVLLSGGIVLAVSGAFPWGRIAVAGAVTMWGVAVLAWVVRTYSFGASDDGWGFRHRDTHTPEGQPVWGWFQWGILHEGLDHPIMMIVYGATGGAALGAGAGAWGATLSDLGWGALAGAVLTVPLLLAYNSALRSAYEPLLHGGAEAVIAQLVPPAQADAEWDAIVERLRAMDGDDNS